MSRLAERWYTGHWSLWLLWPLSQLFRLISGLRRWLFRSGIKSTYRPKASVIVVGNISVGGNGKTPVVLGLAQYFMQAGNTVGILSRGYGSRAPAYPHCVNADDDAHIAGDEPLLLKKRSDLPVVIDPIRRRGAALLEHQFGCDIIICDDGLQHYALARDVEIVVMDDRKWGNGQLLPMGPLREGIWRLNTVDAVLYNTRCPLTDVHNDEITASAFKMGLTLGDWVNVKRPDLTLTASEMLQNKEEKTAIAGIGNPQRFFDQLVREGIELQSQRGFIDHHTYTSQDIPSNMVLMTEKDAVKVSKLAHDNCWYLPVDVDLPEQFYTHIKTRVDSVSQQ